MNILLILGGAAFYVWLVRALGWWTADCDDGDRIEHQPSHVIVYHPDGTVDQ